MKGGLEPGINNSKKLDAATRNRLAIEIKESAVAWSVAFAEVAEIDRVNIYWAGLLAMRRAIDGLSVAPHHVLLDARRLKELPMPQQSIVKGDCKSLTIAAASILAKTARDALMCKLDVAYPGYGFSKHKGYPVPEHLAAIERLGVSAIHRPVALAIALFVLRAVLRGLIDLVGWSNAFGLRNAIARERGIAAYRAWVPFERPAGVDPARTMGADFRVAGQQSAAVSFVAVSFPAHRSRICSFVPVGSGAAAAFHTYSAPRVALTRMALNRVGFAW